MKRAAQARGFTLLETMIVILITSVVLLTTYAVLSAVIQGDDAVRTRVDMQLEASNALKTMVSFIKQSGISTDVPPLPANTYPAIFTLSNPTPTLTPTAGTAPYAWANGAVATIIPHVAVQIANQLLEEGLGPSQGILFRVAKDSSEYDPVTGLPLPGLQHAPLNSTDPNFAIQWGNEFHCFTVAFDPITSTNQLVHLIFYLNPVTQAWSLESQTVVAHNVARLILETSTIAVVPPKPPWPLPSSTVYSSGNWPGKPVNPNEIRITLCLARPDVNNATNSTTSAKRMVTVWQQASINMRSVQHQ